MANDFTDGDLEHLIDQRVDAKLAALGGHLLTTYGAPYPSVLTSAAKQRATALATLGGYLLEEYGDG